MEMKKLKKKLVLFKFLSFLVTTSPLLVLMILNWSKYVKQPADAIKLGLGGALIVVVLVAKAVGKLQVPRMIIAYAFIFVMSYLLKTMMDDMMLISGMALLGEFLDIPCQYVIKSTADSIEREKQADVTTEKVEAVIKQYLGGRV